MSTRKNEDMNFRKLREEKQKSAILSEIEKSLSKKVLNLQEENKKLNKEKKRIESKFSKDTQTLKELEQEKQILSSIVESESKKTINLSKKYYVTIVLAAVTISAIIIPYSLYAMTLVGQEYRVEDLDSIKSSYVIQNLKGDKVDTWLSWRLTDSTLYVNILNAQKYQDKASIVRDAILSTQYYEIDDHLLGKAPKGTITKYYLGWAGALDAASQKDTKFPIPKNIQVISSDNGAGDITITLANTRNGDGFAGITKTIADESQNQILKSDITIYDVENLSENQLRAIMRHEFGHSLGLAHSTAEEDLMHPQLKTEYPYISHCNINAITDLYDGSQKSEVVCEK